MMMSWKWALLLCMSCLLLETRVEAQGLFITPNITQNSTVNNTAFEKLLDTCKGIVVRYKVVGKVEKIIPLSSKNKTQPYRFVVEGDLTNAGYDELNNWELFIGFQYHEVIAESLGISFLDGSTTPGALVENGTTIVGTDTPDLLTSIATAEDFDLIAAKFNLTGTEFGVGPEQPVEIPFPKNLTIVNPGYYCKKPFIDQNTTMLMCCPENKTVIPPKVVFRRREKGDITITYDVLQTFSRQYTAQVTIEMDDPIGRLNHWNLTWDWKQGEFITSMVGAQTLEQVQDECLNGPPGELYPDMDFSTVMNCQRTPTIVDLSRDRMADQQLKGCCRNGTLLPEVMDPAQTKSIFKLTVFKIRPNLQRSNYAPPLNWRIGELLDDTSPYKCGNPKLVSPSEFFTTGLHYDSAVKSWQLTCNQTVIPKGAPHKCCVSFSAFYNSSVVPCPTCACGCKKARMEPNNMVCNADPDVEAMLLPSYALLLPPSNRTKLAKALAKLDHRPEPNPLPCPDNCGASINWHIYSDYANGFSARITLFNWKPEVMSPWFTVLEFGKAMPGYQNVYSFNGTKIVGYEKNPKRSLIFMHGKEGYNNDLLGLDEGIVPGKLQSLLSFDKRKTPGIDVVKGDGYPKRVWFNGDECALPDILPTSSARRSSSRAGLVLILSLVVAVVAALAASS